MCFFAPLLYLIFSCLAHRLQRILDLLQVKMENMSQAVIVNLKILAKLALLLKTGDASDSRLVIK